MFAWAKSWSALLVVCVAFSLFDLRQAEAQEIMVVSPATQQFAIENKFFLTIPPTSIAYMDLVATVDVIASRRAQLSGRQTPNQDDRQFASWLICLLPWTPPKSAATTSTLQKVRPMLIQGAYTSEARRQGIRDRLNPKLTPLSGVQLREQEVSPLMVLSLAGLQ